MEENCVNKKRKKNLVGWYLIGLDEGSICRNTYRENKNQ